MELSDITQIELEYLKLEDYQALKEVMISAYHNVPELHWEESQIESLLEKFPEGQVVIKANGKLAGCALSIIVDYDQFEGGHTYQEVTGGYTFSTHDEEGDMLYGVDVFIKPEFRGLRIGRRLYDYRKELCEKRNLKGIAFGGRIPNYHKYADRISPKEYIEKVRLKEIEDPVLNFQISNDFHPHRILRNYMEGDAASGDYAVLLEWDNIYYEKPARKAKTQKKVVRLGLIQWQMRPYRDLGDLLEQSEYFIDSVSGYRPVYGQHRGEILRVLNFLQHQYSYRKYAGAQGRGSL